MSQLKEAIAQVRGYHQGDIVSLRHYINDNYPDVIKALRSVDNDISQPKRRKGFNLVKRESKKHGFIYYARFSHEGKMLPTKFNTYTNDVAAAELYARDNKDRLVEEYLTRKEGRIYKQLAEFFDIEQNLCISEESRKEYKNMIEYNFIPFLQKERISSFSQITKVTLVRYQDNLQSSERAQKSTETRPANRINASSVNNNMKPVKKILAALFRRGVIIDNPGESIKRLKVNETDRRVRGCYDLEKIKGVFNKRWANEEAYLLCLLIYTTGMRNSEIKRICLNDILTINGCRFVNVKKSKTGNGVRIVPLHDFVYRKLKTWAMKTNADTSFLLFGLIKDNVFKKANKELARVLKVSADELKRENISFYSGRHYWKTLMSAEGLGEDIEEIFMGHKVVGDVKKLYNHKDKHGKVRLIKKTKQMFLILDRCIFKKP